MRGETDHDLHGLERFRRYVPLIVWMMAIVVLVFIPLKIIGYDYLPYDDALADAAKAASGRPWTEIIVAGPAFTFDHHFGWHWFLREIYLATHCSVDGLVTVEVVGLFLACCCLPLLSFKR